MSLLVLSFSCWNTALNSFKQQELEVDLKPERSKTVSTNLLLKPHIKNGRFADAICVVLEDLTDSRKAIQQNEEDTKFLELLGSLIEIFRPAARKNRNKTINGILEKIGVISYVQYAFVSRIDSLGNLVCTDFKWQGRQTPGSTESISALPLDAIHPVLEKLQEGVPYITENFSSLSTSEANLWKRWHPGVASPGSIICELIYRDQQPVGIIGLVRTEQGEWPKKTIMLVQLAAQLLSETLPKSLSGSSILRRSTPLTSKESIDDILSQSEEVYELEEYEPEGYEPEEYELEDVEVILDDYEVVEDVGGGNERMQIEAYRDGNPDGAHRVSETSEGDYTLQCPQCEKTEFIPAALFDTSGLVLKVTCPCSCSFRIIREMRKNYRKKVQLPGSCSRGSDNPKRMDSQGKWLSMEITNISKGGLNFETPMATLFTVGEHIQLRFALDNSSRSLIDISAIIRSVRKNEVGCQFQESEKHETTLGFYFL